MDKVLNNIRIFSVSEISNYIKNIFESESILSCVFIKGEISNLKVHSSGHMYFTLKDNDSRIRSVMFKGNRVKLKFMPYDGLSIIVRGYISIYEKDGQYQLYVQDMIVEGTGALYKAYEQLKAKLELLGLFDIDRKKQLPNFPKSIGVVTSPTGAAVRDIISIIKRRYDICNIYLYPVLVQGDNAAFEISSAIEYFNKSFNVDLLIIGRGGGSIEELWAFNEEIVARAIADSNIPIVSAVGHETDFTISDFVADIRAATPSAAAELAVPDKAEINSNILNLKLRLDMAMRKVLKDKDTNLKLLSKDKAFTQIERKLMSYHQSLDILDRYLQENIISTINNLNNKIYTNIQKLNVLNPAAILCRGYGFISKEETNKIITSVEDTDIGDKIKIVLKDGYILSNVIDKAKEKSYEDRT